MLRCYQLAWRRGVLCLPTMKNCEPLVSWPALAIDSRPGVVCFSLKFSAHTQHSSDQRIVTSVCATATGTLDRFDRVSTEVYVLSTDHP